VLAGTISDRRQFDGHARTATLTVEDSIAGKVAPGAATKITWEEWSPSRQVRFDEGEGVLVVLDPIPSQSIWTKRFARPENRADYIVAEHGDAFVRSPDAASIDSLLHYLAIAPGAREGAPGAMRLAEIAASA